MEYTITVVKHWIAVGQQSSAEFTRRNKKDATGCYKQEIALIRKLQEHHQLAATVTLHHPTKKTEITKL